MKAHQFSKTATPESPDILGGKTALEFLATKYQKGCIFGLNDLQNTGCYKLAGWCFDFREHLHRFLVKQYGSWQEYYAPNKNMLRCSLYGRIQEVVAIN